MNRQLLLFSTFVMIALFASESIAATEPNSREFSRPDIQPIVAQWELKTDDTSVKLVVRKNRVLIAELKHPAQGWNWTPAETSMPLIACVNGVKTDWIYQNATVDTSAGKLVTLIFINQSPRLELKSFWSARPGAGPVETWMTIENKTGGDVTYNQRDILAADLNIVADSQVTLTRFNKCGVPTATHLGILQQTLGAHQSVNSTLRNTDDWIPDQSLLGFQMFNVGNLHGLYIGYAWSFGKFLTSTGSDGKAINYKAYLWDQRSFSEPNGKIVKIPPIYLGTYQGDLDDGGNRFKQWFWRNKMPASVRDNADEPPIEYCVPGNEADLKKFFQAYDMKKWGAELAKIDIDWLAGVVVADQNTWFGDEIVKWEGNPKNWPHGMTAGTIVHGNKQKLALYFPNTYKWGDLGVQKDRDAEKTAHLSRFDEIGYDYLRSDFFCENNARDDIGPSAYQGGAFYLSHEGYMEVLDALIAKRPGFKYEGCSAGPVSDFDSLQRVNFAVAMDGETADGHRQTMYSNLYCINPVQLKADINILRGIDGKINEDPDAVWVKYCLRSGFMGANMAAIGGFSISSTVAAQMQIHWPLYAQRMRPILRGADVYHILPICDKSNWDGMEYFNPRLGAQGKGAVLLFKPAAKTPDALVVQLRGLADKTMYALTFQDRSAQNCKMTGGNLMHTGIRVTGMTGASASEIIWIEAAP